MNLVGVGLAVLGMAIMVGGIVARLDYVRNMLNPDSLPLWFRAEGLVLLGGSMTILGLFIAGRAPWPVLIAVAIFGAAAIVFLRARVRWW